MNAIEKLEKEKERAQAREKEVRALREALKKLEEEQEEAEQEDWNRMHKVLAECEDSQTSEKLSAALGKMLEIMQGQMRKE